MYTSHTFKVPNLLHLLHPLMSSSIHFPKVDYRGATVEDLDIRPAISINPSTSLNRAMEVSFENEFTYLPVIDETHKTLLGVLNVEYLEKNRLGNVEPITKNYMLWFSQTARERYEKNFSKKTATPLNSKIIKPTAGKGKHFHVLTPLTPLETLAEFFNAGNFFAIITNGEGNLVYGVVTPEDLTKYEHARPHL